MGKEYRYRKHIRWGQYAILAFFILIFLLMIVLSGFYLWNSGFTFWAIIPVFLGLVFLIVGGLLWYLYYRLAGTVVSINDDALNYKNRTGEKRIPIESIHLEFSSVKYTGGWLKIKTGTDTIRLTVVLEDISGFLQELKTALDNKQLSSHYDAHKLFEFLKTAASSDQSWERAYALFGKIFLMILDAGIAIFTGYVFGTIPFFGLVIVVFWGGFSMFWITSAYIIAEIILMRQIAKKSDEAAFTFPPRDLSYEKLVYDKTFMGAGMAYFFISSFALVLGFCVKILLQQ